MRKFILKHIDNRKPQVKAYPSNGKKENVTKENNGKIIKETQVMTTSEKIEMAQNVLNNQNNMAAPVKRVKRDKGLIERTESSKTVLTEDNKELLND